jgi:hypothetical protein
MNLKKPRIAPNPLLGGARVGFLIQRIKKVNAEQSKSTR